MKINIDDKIKDLKPIKNFDLEGFEEPFGYISSYHWLYDKKKNKNIKTFMKPFDFLRDIPGEKTYDIGDFPKNIKRCYWLNIGGNEGGEDPWQLETKWNLLCYLDNGVYLYMSAWADYTGIDCQGDVILWSSKKIQILIDMALSNQDRHNLSKFI
jgi:hypothetical protein